MNALIDLTKCREYHGTQSARRLEKSKKMVEYYQKSCPSDLKGSFLYEVKLQNNDDFNKKITGTYVPKELILDKLR
jgi:hypothetical protein